MFKKLALPILILGTALIGAACGGKHVSVYYGSPAPTTVVAPSAIYPAQTGYYDRFGYFHQTGFYDAAGFWHPY